MTATNIVAGTDKKPSVTGPDKDASQSAAAGGEDAGHSNRSIGGKKLKPVLEENKAGMTFLDQSGYNPKRREFDPEYDNDAELPLAEMEFKEIDTETDRELKLRMLHIYLSRLDERKRRKEFILERGLLDVKRQQELDNKRSKEERELYQQARVFLRYQSREEHEALLAGLNTERKIRQHISDLQECQSAGCRTLTEAERYKSEKKKREEAGLQKAKEVPAQLAGGKDSSQKVNLVASGATGSFSKDSNRSNTFDITELPGTCLLSSTEQRLCCHNRILPANYLRMKEILMLESFKSGRIKRSDAQHLLKANPSKVDSVFDLLLKMGWIQSDDKPTSRDKC